MPKITFLTRILIAFALLFFLGTAAVADETVWLSSLDLSKAIQGYGEPQADKTVDHHPITLSGRTFARGFGTHSIGYLVIDLNGGTKRFTATVGIDDEVQNGRGSAEFQVLDASRKILWRSGILKQGQPPKQIDLDLTGVKQILLYVTDGGDGYEFDHADWADAQFEVTGQRPTTVNFRPGQTEPAVAFIAASPAPQIHPPFVVAVRTGTPLLWTVPITGARPITVFVKGLPPELTLNPSTGTLTGTPAKAGDYPVRIEVKSKAGHDTRTVHLLVGKTLVQTPALGWNSYDCFGDDVTEAEILANARYLLVNMQPYGWDTVVVDYRWYDPDASSAPNNTGARAGATLTMDASGRLLPAPNRFPSAANGQGFKGLADQIHAMGLKFGIHIMRGIPRNAVKANLPIEGTGYTAGDAANTGDLCPWCPDMYGVRGATPAGQAYYDSLFRLYASWGVDYVKMDDTSSPYHTDEIEAVHNAIEKCGRSIVYSLSPGETPIAQGTHVAAHANLWRVSGDFWDNWPSLNHEFTLGVRWHDFAAPGHWPDADMLPVGHVSVSGRSVGPDRRTNFTHAEQLTLLSLWALLPSPLMVGANLPDNDPWTLALLTNPELLAVHQDFGGIAGKRIVQHDETEVWSRTLADGSRAVGLFNRSDWDGPVTVTRADLGLEGTWSIRDLWQHKEQGRFPAQFTATVPAHGVVLFLLSRQR